MSSSEWDKLKTAAQYIQVQIEFKPKIAVVLGSGLANTLSNLRNSRRILWSEIPSMPQPTIKEHLGVWEFGELHKQQLVVQRGRVHFYEGYSMQEIAFPVRVLRLLGVEILILTNAAGAINEEFSVGDFVLLNDHINLIPDNPLRGENIDSLGPRYPNMNNAYDETLQNFAHHAAREMELQLKEGVYVATPGPMFETPAEIQAYGSWGADLVGMSTVPEVIAARHAGLRVLGISCVTNMAAGVASSIPDSDEVLKITESKGTLLTELLEKMLPML